MPDPSQRADDLSGTDPSHADSTGADQAPLSTTVLPTASPRPGSEHLHRRPPTRFLAPATLRRELGLVVVGLASIAIGLLAFLTAAWIMRFPLAVTAFRFDTT